MFNLLLLEQKRCYYSMEEYKKAAAIYDSCEHIFICTQIIDCDAAPAGLQGEIYEEREYKCIKCGLDPKSGLPKFGPKIIQSPSEQIMTEYFRQNPRDFQEKETDIVCDFNLAQAIYFKIKEAHPDIDDEKIVQYMKIALDDIRNIKVNDERKENRAIRLSLNPKFNKWNSSDVHPECSFQFVKRFPKII